MIIIRRNKTRVKIENLSRKLHKIEVNKKYYIILFNNILSITDFTVFLIKQILP